MKKSGINLVSIKEYNRALITQLICTNPHTTRNSLAKRSHLTAMTLTNITSELIQKGIIVETENRGLSKGIGRSPKILELSPTSPIVAGIWLSKDFIFGIICDFTLKLITAKRINFQPEETEDTILEKMAALTQYLLEFTNRPVVGLGISTIGVVDAELGSIKKATNFFDIAELHIKEYLNERFDLPIYVKNDMQSSALCEMYYGIGKKKDDFIYVGITNGVGSAVVSGKQLLNSAVGSCGELGHMTIDYQGPRCTCGSCGCLEMYASVPRILAQINQECNVHLVTMRQAMEYCLTDQKAGNVLDDIAERLVYALNNLINIVNIETVVLGHSGILFPDSMLEQMKNRINKINIFRNIKTIGICKTKFAENSPLFGAACIVLDEIFTGHLTLWD